MSNRLRKHARFHHTDGLDPLDLASIAGTLTDTQHATKTGIPDAHHTKLHAGSHHNGGTDPLDLASIAGTLTDTQHGDKTGIPDAHHSSNQPLTEHSDVEITAPADAELLTYEAATTRIHDVYATTDHQKISMGSTFPATPVDGELFYHTATHGLFIYDGNVGMWRPATDYSTLVSLAADGCAMFFESVDAQVFSRVGSGAYSLGYRSLVLRTGTTAGSYVLMRSPYAVYAGRGWYVFRFHWRDYDPALKATFWMAARPATVYDIHDVSQHIGIKITGGRLYATNSDGVAQTITDLGPIDPRDYYFLMRFKTGEVTWWDKDWNLLATHTANIPGVNAYIFKVENVNPYNAVLTMRAHLKTSELI